MSAQFVITILLIVAAAGYLGYSTFRLLRGQKAGCGGKCACPGDSNQQVVALGTQRLAKS